MSNKKKTEMGTEEMKTREWQWWGRIKKTGGKQHLLL